MSDPIRRSRLPRALRGLSARLLLLTVSFVMLSEVLIYVPSVSRFRLSYLEERLAAAGLASLALKASSDLKVSEELENELLKRSGLKGIIIKEPTSRSLMLSVDMPGKIEGSYDLRSASALDLMMDAFGLLLAPPRNIRVIDALPGGQPGFMEIIMHEGEMRRAMIVYSTNILSLSLVISFFTAMLVYLSLHILMVLPMRRLMASMIRFRRKPEDASNVINPTGRGDEIGAAERELAEMQGGLRKALRQQARLATLGSGVSKINHDLRNILAAAQLVSDRLVESDDPQVQRLVPTLVKSIDRAIVICGKTLSFSKADETPAQVTRFGLKHLLDDVALFVGLEGDISVAWTCEVEKDLEVQLDRDQAFRIFLNIGRNSVDAIRTAKQTDGVICVSARQEDDSIIVTLADNGPGLPEEARVGLFQPFAGSTRTGGTGLGLAIARELARGHNGDVTLLNSDDTGTAFQVRLKMETVSAAHI